MLRTATSVGCRRLQRTPCLSVLRRGYADGQHLDNLKQRRQSTIDQPPTTSPNAQRTSHTHPVPRPGPKAAGSREHVAVTGKALKRVRGVEKKEEIQPQSVTDADPIAQAADMERVMNAAEAAGNLDLWSGDLGTLDVTIPPYVADPTWLDKLIYRWEDSGNIWGNYLAVVRLAKDDVLSGQAGLYTQRFSPLFHWRALRCALDVQNSSIADKTWVSGIREEALETYVQVNSAVARADYKTIKDLTTVDYYTQASRLAKSYARPDRVYEWKYLGENTPTRIVSLRSSIGYLARNEPLSGSRLYAQALVRFDTTQAFSARERRGGKALFGGSKRVVEHLVLERRFWYGEPWRVREQIFEDLEDVKQLPLQGVRASVRSVRDGLRRLIGRGPKTA